MSIKFFAVLLGIGLPIGVGILLLLFPYHLLCRRYWRPKRQEDMPHRTWFQVKRVFHEKRGVILELKEDKPFGRIEFCALWTPNSDVQQEYLDEALAKVGEGLCVSFYQGAETDRGIVYQMDCSYSSDGTVNISHLLWTYSNYYK